MPAWERVLRAPRLSDHEGVLSEGYPGAERIYWVYPYPPKWPIFVQQSGNSVWRKGDYWRRRKSHRITIELVTRGDFRLVQNRREYLVKHGQAFILHRGADHLFTTGPAGCGCKRMVGLEGAGVESIFGLTGLDRIDVLDAADPVFLAKLIKDCQRLLHGRPAGYEKCLSVNAYAIVSELLVSSGAQRSPLVRQTLDMMYNSMGAPLSNADLAARAGVSPAYLLRQFQIETEQSPHRYHTEMRIAAARHLLHTTDLPIKEIALRLGFDDPLYFSRVFRRTVGRSPKSFRREANRS